MESAPIERWPDFPPPIDKFAAGDHGNAPNSLREYFAAVTLVAIFAVLILNQRRQSPSLSGPIASQQPIPAVAAQVTTEPPVTVAPSVTPEPAPVPPASPSPPSLAEAKPEVQPTPPPVPSVAPPPPPSFADVRLRIALPGDWIEPESQMRYRFDDMGVMVVTKPDGARFVRNWKVSDGRLSVSNQGEPVWSYAASLSMIRNVNVIEMRRPGGGEAWLVRDYRAQSERFARR